MNSVKFSIVTLLFLFWTSLTTIAQEYKVSDKSTFKIEGTSSMHDWESEVKEYSGNASLEMEGNTIKDIKSLKVTMKVESIESGKSKMNSLTYEAFKSKNNPNIIFQLTEVTDISNGNITAKGKLTMAGMTQPITVIGKATVSGNTITIVGKQKIDMTQFKMDPPTALMGTIKVGKDVSINYSLVLTK